MSRILLGVLAIFLFKMLSYAAIIRGLERRIQDLKEERPQIWMESCKYSVDETCNFGECATIPIEIIQKKVCRVPDDL